MTQFFERNNRPISANVDFGLVPGDELFCRKGFIFTDHKSKDSSAAEVRVTVIDEYPRFILVRVIFDGDESRSYKECINKAAYIGHDADFIKVGKKHIFSDFGRSLFASYTDMPYLADPGL